MALLIGILFLWDKFPTVNLIDLKVIELNYPNYTWNIPAPGAIQPMLQHVQRQDNSQCIAPRPTKLICGLRNLCFNKLSQVNLKHAQI